MVEFNVKKLIRGIIDVALAIFGMIWVWALFTFAQGTMDTSMAAEEVTRYQIESLIALVAANIFMVILFRFRKKITIKIDEEQEQK